MKESGWVKVGQIGVDAGLCWLGDPCYILQGDRPKDVGKDWDAFCERLFKNGSHDFHQFNYDAGHAGLGVCVSTGYGDGVYDVEVKKQDGRVKEVRVKFF